MRFRNLGIGAQRPQNETSEAIDEQEPDITGITQCVPASEAESSMSSVPRT